MPCSGDQYDLSEREKERAEAVEILRFFYNLEHDRSIKYPDYRDFPHTDNPVGELCERLRSMDDVDIGKLVTRFITHRPAAKLLDWWQRHLAADQRP